MDAQGTSSKWFAAEDLEPGEPYFVCEWDFPNAYSVFFRSIIIRRWFSILLEYQLFPILAFGFRLLIRSSIENGVISTGLPEILPNRPPPLDDLVFRVDLGRISSHQSYPERQNTGLWLLLDSPRMRRVNCHWLHSIYLCYLRLVHYVWANRVSPCPWFNSSLMKTGFKGTWVFCIAWKRHLRFIAIR
jgi:hypothetical protein